MKRIFMALTLAIMILVSSVTHLSVAADDEGITQETESQITDVKEGKEEKGTPSLSDDSKFSPEDFGFSLYSVIDENLITDFELTLIDENGVGIDIPGPSYEIDDLDAMNSLKMNVEITIPEEMHVSDGDTYSFVLPSIYQGSTPGPVEVSITGGVVVGTYEIVDGVVTITFNDKISNLDTRVLEVNITGVFDKEVFNNETEVVIDVPFADGNSYEATLTVKPKEYQGEDKKTAGEPYILENGEKVFTDKNATHIDWVVRLNDGMETVASAKLVDELDENHKIDLASIKVFKLIRNWKNEIIGREPVSVTFVQVGNGFEIDLGDIEDAYEIEYTTELIRPDGGGKVTIKNDATIILDDESNSYQDTADVNWSTDIPVIEKKGKISDDRDDIINWEVKYNFGLLDLGEVILTDELSKGEIILSTIVVYEVETDIDGNITEIKDEIIVTATVDATGNVIIESLDAQSKAYLITFDSVVQAGYKGEVLNTISDNLEEPNSDNDIVEIDTIPNGGKVGHQYIDENGFPYIEWTITINTQKIDVGSITLGDLFDRVLLDFDVNDPSLYELYKDGEISDNFTIEDYTHPDNREGFKLSIHNAGPHTYKFVYRTYYTELGMQEPHIANEAELVFFYGDGPGTSLPLDFKLEGPLAQISKTGKYVTSEDKKTQEIEWTVTFNKSEILLTKPTLDEIFASNNFEFIAGTLSVKADGVEYPSDKYDFSLKTFTITHDDGTTETLNGFSLAFKEDTKAVFTLTFRTTVDDDTNPDHVNKAILTWQGGSEEAQHTLPKRVAGLSKSGTVVINDDGSKTVVWTVKFNTNKHVYKGDVVVTDTYTPNTVTVNSVEVSRNNVLMDAAEYSLSNPVNGPLTVTLNGLDAVEYKLVYKTTLSATQEMTDLNNKVNLKYTSGVEDKEATIKKPLLGIQKEATSLDKEPDNAVISWKITANTDSTNKLVNLVNPVLTDTIPGDQRLLGSTIKVVNVATSEDITSSLTITFNDNSFLINLPDGAYQYVVTFDTEILEYPSFDGSKLDRYNNSATLANDGYNPVSDNAYQDYYLGGASDLLHKSGHQNEDTENIDWEITVNQSGLTIKNPKIIDTLNLLHTYLEDSIVLKDTQNNVLEKGVDYFVVFSVEDEKQKMEITFKDDILNQALVLSYSTRLLPHLIGNYIVRNTIELLGGTQQKSLEIKESSTSSQQWFFGGGGSGRNIRFNLLKENEIGETLSGIEFELYLVKLNGSETLVDVEITTDANGFYLSGDIRAGRYVLKEKSVSGLKDIDPIYLLLGYGSDGEFVVTIMNSGWVNSTHSNATVEGNQLTVVNEYEAIELNIDALLSITKVLTGQDLRAGQFDFVLKEGNSVLQEKPNALDGSVVFDKLSFSGVGVYTYTISEVEGTQGGIDYDDTVYTLEITVSYINDDPAKGLTISSVTLDGDPILAGALGLIVFENDYAAKETNAQFTASKSLTGQTLTDERFTFHLLAEDGSLIEEVKNDTDGNIVFSEIEYKAVGDYYYTIVEVDDEQGGVTYDKTVYLVKVIVTDDGIGKLHAKVEYSIEVTNPDSDEVNLVEVNELQFANSYATTATSAQFLAHKSLTGQTLTNGRFTFRLLAEDDSLIEEVTNDVDGNIVFSEIEYSSVGDYYYTIVEADDEQGGITYDKTVYLVKVSVIDNNVGQLVASVVYSKQIIDPETQEMTEVEVQTLDFANSYFAQPTKVQFVAKKSFSGLPLTDDRFEFELLDVNDELVESVGNSADGTVLFSEITYHTVGVYQYTLKEVDDEQGGVSYDEREYAITVDIKDDGVGKLYAEVSYNLDEEEQLTLDFVNSYEAAPTSLTFEAFKELVGQPLWADQFEFELSEQLDFETISLQRKTNDEDGLVQFDAIEFTEPGIYTFTILEVDAGYDYMDFDPATYIITVTVVDNEVGQLVATYVIEKEVEDLEIEEVEEIVFNNMYYAKAVNVQFMAEKVLTGQELTEGRFTFNLVDEDGEIVEEVTNLGSGLIIFSELTFDEVGEYLFTIEEVDDNQGGIKYHETPFSVKVIVTDNREGQLEAFVEYEVRAEFENEYSFANAVALFEGVKTLTGRPLVAGEFKFEVRFGDIIMDIVTHDKDGQILFNEFEFVAPGTYTYEVSEVNNKLPGVTYDETKFKVVVTVIDNGVGQLVASVEVIEDDIEFENKYEADKVSITIEAEKHLKGQKLTADQFTFNLMDESGEVVLTTQNDANGKVSFENLEFDTVGKYTFTLSEVKGSQKGMTYDTTVYTIVVTVTDDLKGNLVAEVVHDKLIFTNEYKEKLPGTGSDNNTSLLIAGTSILVAGGYLVLRSLRKEEN